MGHSLADSQSKIRWLYWISHLSKARGCQWWNMNKDQVVNQEAERGAGSKLAFITNFLMKITFQWHAPSDLS